MTIHPTAVNDGRAEIDGNSEIGPFVVIDGPVRIGAGTRVLAHAVVTGKTTLGRDNVIHMGAVIGHEPQDLGYRGAETELLVGDRNVFREHCEVHRASQKAATVIGDDNYFMSHAHVAHDCRIGNRVIMANAATLAGHVTVSDGANIGAYSGVHQFCRVGREAYVGGYSVVVKDALPFALTVGNHARCYGLNVTGMRRRGYGREATRALHHAFHLLLSSRLNTTQALERIREELKDSPEVDELVRFIETSERGVIK